MARGGGKSDGMVEAEAAGALWALSEGHDANKVSIAGAGAIATLCQLLGSPNERAQRHAASALSTLCDDNAENMKQVGLARCSSRICPTYLSSLAPQSCSPPSSFAPPHDPAHDCP